MLPLARYRQGTSISIHNLASAFGAELTADLDLDSITETDPDDKFSVSGPLFENLAAGQRSVVHARCRR